MSDAELARLRGLIVAHDPALAGAAFRLLDAGWDSAAVEVDGRWLFKFPRDADAAQQLEREARLLAMVRRHVTLPVPDLAIVSRAPVFSRHAMIPGEHLNRADYEALDATRRVALAEALAGFFADLHAIPLAEARAAGAADEDDDWPSTARIVAAARAVLPAALADKAAAIVADWAALPPDPLGPVFAFLDAHGWNMAFDYADGRLNGLYDFGDAAIAPLHSEFVHIALTSYELCEQVMRAYEVRTGRTLDPPRVETAIGMLLLAELAEEGDHATSGPTVRERAVQWISRS